MTLSFTEASVRSSLFEEELEYLRCENQRLVRELGSKSDEYVRLYSVHNALEASTRVAEVQLAATLKQLETLNEQRRKRHEEMVPVEEQMRKLLSTIAAMEQKERLHAEENEALRRELATTSERLRREAKWGADEASKWKGKLVQVADKARREESEKNSLKEHVSSERETVGKQVARLELKLSQCNNELVVQRDLLNKANEAKLQAEARLDVTLQEFTQLRSDAANWRNSANEAQCQLERVRGNVEVAEGTIRRLETELSQMHRDLDSRNLHNVGKLDDLVKRIERETHEKGDLDQLLDRQNLDLEELRQEVGRHLETKHRSPQRTATGARKREPGILQSGDSERNRDIPEPRKSSGEKNRSPFRKRLPSVDTDTMTAEPPTTSHVTYNEGSEHHARKEISEIRPSLVDNTTASFSATNPDFGTEMDTSGIDAGDSILNETSLAPELQNRSLLRHLPHRLFHVFPPSSSENASSASDVRFDHAPARNPPVPPLSPRKTVRIAAPDACTAKAKSKPRPRPLVQELTKPEGGVPKPSIYWERKQMAEQRSNTTRENEIRKKIQKIIPQKVAKSAPVCPIKKRSTEKPGILSSHLKHVETETGNTGERRRPVTPSRPRSTSPSKAPQFFAEEGQSIRGLKDLLAARIDELETAYEILDAQCQLK